MEDLQVHGLQFPVEQTEAGSAEQRKLEKSEEWPGGGAGMRRPVSAVGTVGTGTEQWNICDPTAGLTWTR